MSDRRAARRILREIPGARIRLLMPRLQMSRRMREPRIVRRIVGLCITSGIRRRGLLVAPLIERVRVVNLRIMRQLRVVPIVAIRLRRCLRIEAFEVAGSHRLRGCLRIMTRWRARLPMWRRIWLLLITLGRIPLLLSVRIVRGVRRHRRVVRLMIPGLIDGLSIAGRWISRLALIAVTGMRVAGIASTVRLDWAAHRALLAPSHRVGHWRRSAVRRRRPPEANWLVLAAPSAVPRHSTVPSWLPLAGIRASTRSGSCSAIRDVIIASLAAPARQGCPAPLQSPVHKP